MTTQLCRGFRDTYTLNFTKISTTYPIQFDGTYVDGDKLLIVENGRYSLYTPLTAPYTCEEHGLIVDNGDNTMTMTPLRIIGCNSGVDGYAATFADLPACDSTKDGQIYQVGEYPNSEWYQCNCIGGSCSWSDSANPICEEIDSLLDLPDEPCSGSKIYYGSFASDGSNIFYGCVAGTWLDVINPNDALSQEGSACIGLPLTANFNITEGYGLPRNSITAFDFTIENNSGFAYDCTGVISGTDIIVTVPYGTDVTSLVPEITILGARVSPNTLVSNDFTNEVLYSCYSSDGTVKEYTVTVNVASAADCEISEFWFSDGDNTVLSSDFYGVIVGNEIIVNLPYGVNVTALVASYVTTATDIQVSSVSQTSGTTANDFTSSITYVCYDNNGDIVNYIVTVYVSTSQTVKLIESFVLRAKDNKILGEDYTGVIDQTAKTIEVTVPERSNFSEVYPTISITGVSVTTKSKTAADFSTNDSTTFTVYDYLNNSSSYTATIIASDDPKQEIGITFYGDSEDTADSEDITRPSGWVDGVNLSLSFPAEIKDILTNVKSHISRIKSFLNIGKSALNIVRILLSGVGNPVLAAFDFFLTDLITFINNLKNSGFFFAQIIPDTKLFYEIFIDQTVLNPHYRDGKLERLLSELTAEERRVYDKLVLGTREIKFFGFKKAETYGVTASEVTALKDPSPSQLTAIEMKNLTTEQEVLQTLTSEASRQKVVEAKYLKNLLMSGFWLLPGDSALKLYAESFDNIDDYDQPLYDPPIPIKNYSYYNDGKITYKKAPTLLDKDTVLAGGMILWLGFSGGVDLIKAIKTFMTIIRQLIYFFDDPKLKALSLELQELQNRFWTQWKPNHKYYIGDVVTRIDQEPRVIDSQSGERRTLDKYKYVCTKVGSNGYGTSGSTEPTWPEDYKGTVRDNNITWTESSITDFTVREDQPKFWQKRKLFKDWFPAGGEILNELEYVLSGFKDKIPTGLEAIEDTIDYIESRINELDTLITLIESFISLIESFDELNDFDMRGYMVPVQNGGIAKLIDGSLDDSDDNKPSSSDYTLGLFSFIGSGASVPGYLLLVDMLFGSGAYPSEFKNAVNQASYPWGLDLLDESPFPDEETLRSRFFDEDRVTSEIEAESDDIVTNTPF